MLRAAPLAPALLLLALAACERAAPGACPGEPVGRFQLTGLLESATCAAGPAAGLAAALPASFSAVTTVAADGGAATLCGADSGGTRPTGTRSGDAFDVSAGADATAFGACGGTCSARAVERTTFTLQRDATGAVTGLSGAVDDAWSEGSGCDACTLPCTARYTLTGTLVP